MTIGIGEDVPLSEPMWFFLEKASAPADVLDERRQPLAHPAGVLEITSIAIMTAGRGKWSEPALAAMDTGCVSLVQGDQDLMEITFDNGRRGRHHDFRPALPLVFYY